jgi:hypothetical protein
MSLEKYDLSKVPAIQWGIRDHELLAISTFTAVTGIKVSERPVQINE